MTETIKIAVCDDEKNIRSYLVSLIKKQGRECNITEYDSADAYLSDGKEHDILFLDIKMGGFGAGLDGMGLARHIRGIKAPKQPIIIFVTGYEKYVYDAFDVGAFQYLVKPVDEKKFAEVFGRAAGQIVSEAEQRKKKLVIQYGGEGKVIPLNDIYYMESRNHNIVLYLKDGNIEYYAKIGDLEVELAGQFYRIHRGYLLLSRYKYDGFVQAYMDYISEESL